MSNSKKPAAPTAPVKAAPAGVPSTENADLAVVNQLGDVTEKMTAMSPLSGETIEIQPLKKLPKSHAHLAKLYPTAKGFTEEGSSIAFHF